MSIETLKEGNQDGERYTFFVESEGVKLPDGSVFGAGIEPMFEIVSRSEGDYLDVFRIYQCTGEHWMMICEPMRYREMREWVHSMVKHYDSCGMKLLEANLRDWDKASGKKLVTLDW